MKKIILLLASFILSAHAINCIDIQFNRFNFADLSDYTLDSVTTVNGNKNDSWYDTYTFHRDGSNVVDSVISDGENIPYSLISRKGPNNTTITDSYIEGSFESTSTLYKDSIYRVSYWYWKEGHEQDTANVSILFLRNDTLHYENYDYTHGEKKLNSKTHTIMDSSSNKCYMYYTTLWGNAYNGEGKESGVSWIEENGNSLVWYEIDKVQYDSTYTTRLYYSKNNGELTTVHRKAKISTTNKQFQYFDLMGRPAKNRNIIKVMK